ncbi:STAS domain-containing protein [Nitrospirillum amazonense]|nr:STAS domain-containing protein [Nitrospirillum amazonense]
MRWENSFKGKSFSLINKFATGEYRPQKANPCSFQSNSSGVPMMPKSSNDDVGKVVFEGARTLRNAEETHAALLSAMKAHAVLEIDCGALDEVDISFVQLLLAARKSARDAQRVLKLAQPVSGPLRDTLHRGGFLMTAELAAGVPAPADQTTDSDFWLHTEAR